MKKLLALAVFAICVFAQSVAGHWTVSMDTPHGPMKGSLDFKQDGSKVTGTLEMGPMGSFPLKGNVDGTSVGFDIELPEGQGTLKFTGQMDGGKITGTTTPHEFKWEATR
jgi:hypothetical protein